MATSTAALPEFLPAPAPLRAAGAVLSAAAALLALAAAALASTHAPGPLGAVAGMQALAAVGGVLGLLWSRGRFLTGPVLAMLCAAGTVVLPTLLSYIAHRGALGPVAMKWWALAELLCGSGMAMLALLSAVERDPALRPHAVRGVLLALPAGVLGFAFLFGSRIGLDAVLLKVPTLVRFAGWGVLGLAAAVALCMSAHALAQAFGGAAQAGRRSVSAA